VKLGHFWDLELGKGAWKIAGMEIQIRVFYVFFRVMICYDTCP
jgi:hypothetical protein